MRKIKFRGIERDKGFVYGGYGVLGEQTEYERHIIVVSTLAQTDWPLFFYFTDVEVIPDTVGQFTGLHDKNGKEIYEGDKLRSNTWACDCEVVWIDGGFTLREGETSYNLKANFSDGDGYYLDDIEVIGNIHEATP